MTESLSITADTSGADLLFRKRQRVQRWVLLVWAIGSLGRLPLVAARWPAIADGALVFFGVGSFVVCGFIAWAARCTICGGGIRLNGRTCSRCGHVFPEHTKAPTRGSQ